ncbi:oxidoreductase [Trichoderma arundinaceum]|uniref:Oxidoreductase n=1 Tax=Trichoderma arundinaceum TaxID=490622 RepID=A0A395N8I9_TRIAR|nr:oxidoreductase [Trichoderma arundinaceum]
MNEKYLPLPDPSPLAHNLQFAFSGRTASNRSMKAAMTEQFASWHPDEPQKRGIPTKNLIRVYKRWARGGIGLILTGNSSTSPLLPPFKACMIFLDHLESLLQEFPVAASAVPVDRAGAKKPLDFNLPHEASQVGIDAIVDSFAHAAEYLAKSGYDGLEIYGGHGFFLSGFLSLATNKRTDQYGGRIENRMRVILETREAIRQRVSPAFIVGIKISSAEFQASVFSVEDAQKLGGTAENTITAHRGEKVRESTKIREAYFQQFAEKFITGLSKTKVYITGGLRTVGGLVKPLDVVDTVGLGRPLVQEFNLCKKILESEVVDSIMSKIGPGEFWLALMARNRIIREVGQGKEPMELWREKVVAELRRSYDV